MKAELIRPEGEIQLIAPKNNGWFTIRELQELIGGYIEIVTIATGKAMVIDEDGTFKGLPSNPRATELYRLGREFYKEHIERMRRIAERSGAFVVTIGSGSLEVLGTVIVCDKSMLRL